MNVRTDISCNILDDDELEKLANEKPRRMELRHWIPDLKPKENPFEKGFIKSTYSFPKAFQNRPPSDEFPPLVYRGSTTSLLLRVKEKLEKVSTTTATVAKDSAPVQKKEEVEVKTPMYAICTPDYESHTPPYPPE
jgi:hypothetical protein